MRTRALVLKLFVIVLLSLFMIGSISRNSVGAEKTSDWFGVFTTDNIPVKGCYVVEDYGVFWRSYYFTNVQWADFKDKSNYIGQFGPVIDKVLNNIAQLVKGLYPNANALIGVDFKFITNFEPLVSKNYYINGKRADGIGWGSVILIGNAVKVKCKGNSSRSR